MKIAALCDYCDTLTFLERMVRVPVYKHPNDAYPAYRFYCPTCVNMGGDALPCVTDDNAQEQADRDGMAEAGERRPDGIDFAREGDTTHWYDD